MKGYYTKTEDEVASSFTNEAMKTNKIANSDVVLPMSQMRRSSLKKRQRRRSKDSSSRQGSSLFGGANNNVKSSWIVSQFSKRECIKFIVNKKKNACYCGKVIDEHRSSDLQIVTDDALKWTPETCTKRSPTDAYGEIEFTEDTKNRKPYVRVSHDTAGPLLLRLLQEKWKLDVPTLVISVTGGAKSFHLRPRLKEAFSRGLTKAATSTGAWIITGGTNTGVMKHVGEAISSRTNAGLHSSKINVIGVAPWGVIDNSEMLRCKDGRGLYPAYYSMETSDSSGASLDCNHSHFVLVDNGTSGQYGVEIGLRSRIEGSISKYMKTASNSTTGAIGVPIVMLCLEGGPNTIKTMSEAMKTGVPVVVIDGSGRAADVVALAYRNLVYDERRQINCIDYNHVDEVKRKVEEIFGADSRDRVLSEIEEMLKDENMVTIFRLDDERGSRDLDLAILKSLLKANRSSFSAQLKLALAWNRIDVAKSEIFTEELKLDNFKIEYLHEPMFTALLDNKYDFVSLFLNEGLGLRHFLTLDVLIALYNGIPNGNPIKVLLTKQLAKHENSVLNMDAVGNVMEDLMGDRFKSRYKNNTEFISDKSVFIGSQENPLLSTNSDRPKTLSKPWLDLFTWAVLSNRHHLAHLIWQRGRDNLASALMASKLLKCLSTIAQDIRELADMVQDLVSHGRKFEMIAVGVLEECRRQDDNLAQTIIMKELPDFGYLTCLDIAVSAEDQDFIAHSSCQALLSRLWMGAMMIDTRTWKVVLGIFVPLTIYHVISFHEDEDHLELGDEISRENLVASPRCPTKQKNGTIGNESLPSLQSQCPCDDHYDDAIDLEDHEEDRDVFSTLGNLGETEDQIDVTLRIAHLGYFGRIMRFYQAPCAKFVANVVSYFLFLGLYSFIILTRFRLEPNYYEYVLQAWVLSLLLEEWRQLISQEPRNLFNKIVMYFRDPWNIVDFISLMSFIVATILRYLAYHMEKPNYLIAARIILATDVVIFIVRLLQIFSVNKNLGPKLVMIRKMLTDLKYFLFVLIVFIVGYGIAKQSVLYPNSSVGKAMVGVLNRPYWQMYGELFLDDILEDKVNCTTGLRVCTQPGEEPCSDDHGKWVAPIYMAIYMLFTNILLLNLLIAIFNSTYEKVQIDSDKVWKFQRYDLILEYHNRPSFSPPLIFISHIYMLMRWMFKQAHCCGCEPRKGSSMKMKLTATENEQLSLWEFNAAEVYTHHSMLQVSETLDERVKTIYETVFTVSDGLTTMISNGDISGTKQSRDALQVSRSESQGGKRIIGQKLRDGVETRLEKLEDNVERILELLINQNQRQARLRQSVSFMPEEIGAPSISSVVTSIHIKARQTPYPGSVIQRFKVSDDQVPWEINFIGYNPVMYTAPHVLAKPVWADPDISSITPKPTLAFNEFDNRHKISRKSYVTTYKIQNGYPINPMGRTGVVGRGNLGRWGPNHAADPIVTRWKRTNSGILLDKGKRVLEFIAIQRKDNQQWAIPGGMVDAGQKVSETLLNEFSEEALAKLDMPEAEKKRTVAKIRQLFQGGVEVYKGYVDDPRNTDNSWMETTACNFHDDSGYIFGNLELKAGDDAQAVRWQRVSGNIPLFASHVGILEKVAEIHNAAFY